MLHPNLQIKIKLIVLNQKGLREAVSQTEVVGLFLPSLVLVIQILKFVFVPVVSILEVLDVGFSLGNLPLQSVHLFVELLHLGDVVAVSEGPQRVVEEVDSVSFVFDA